MATGTHTRTIEFIQKTKFEIQNFMHKKYTKIVISILNIDISFSGSEMFYLLNHFIIHLEFKVESNLELFNNL